MKKETVIEEEKVDMPIIEESKKSEECKCGEDCNCGDKCTCGSDCNCKKSKKKIIFVIIGVLLLIGLILGIFLFVIKDDKKDDNNQGNTTEEKEEVKDDDEEKSEEETDNNDEEVTDDKEDEEQDDEQDEYEEEEEEFDPNKDYTNENYSKEKISLYGLEGDFYSAYYASLAISTDYFISYDIDFDGVKETIEVVTVESEDDDEKIVYKILFKDCPYDDECEIKTYYLNTSEILSSISVIDFNEKDNKLDIMFDMLGDPGDGWGGSAYIFDYTNGKTIELSSDVSFINGNGILVTYSSLWLEPSLVSEYVTIDSYGNVKKYDIDLSNINTEVTVCASDGCPYYSYDKNVAIEDALHFEEETKIRLIRYTEEEGFVAELNGKTIYLYTYYLWFD